MKTSWNTGNSYEILGKIKSKWGCSNPGLGAQVAYENSILEDTQNLTAWGPEQTSVPLKLSLLWARNLERFLPTCIFLRIHYFMHVSNSRSPYQATASAQLGCSVTVFSDTVTWGRQRNTHQTFTNTCEGLVGTGHDPEHQEQQPEAATLDNHL